jgi:hypothetical protein
MTASGQLLPVMFALPAAAIHGKQPFLALALSTHSRHCPLPVSGVADMMRPKLLGAWMRRREFVVVLAGSTAASWSSASQCEPAQGHK